MHKLFFMTRVFVITVAASGCVLATPVYEVPLEVRCSTPVALLVGSAPLNEVSGPPIEVDAGKLFENSATHVTEGSKTRVGFPGQTDDIEELLVKVVVDAGGDRGLQFVAVLPVAQESEAEYSFPEGPILIEGDRCPSP